MSNLSVSATANPVNLSIPQSNQTSDLSEQQMIEDILQLLAQVMNMMNSQDSSDSAGMGGGGGGGGGMAAMPQTCDSMSAGAPSSGSTSPTFSDLGSTSGAAGATPSFASSGLGSGPTANAAPTQGATLTANSPGSSGSEGLSTAPQTQALTQAQGQQVASQYVTNLMHDFNLTQPQAQGIVANLWHESGGMNSGINQGGAIGQPSGDMADDNANGYGIAQWGGSRKQGLIDYANQNGLDPSSQAANYGYLKQELETSESGAISAVKNTSNAQDATAAFCNAFEQPSDPEMASRLADLSLVESA
jgi:Phage tail lysozyme